MKKIYRSKKELDNLCGKDEISHQGMVADIEEMENLNLNEFIKENEKKYEYTCTRGCNRS